jgi:hypothetical protein
MLISNSRPLLLMLAGAGVGALLTFGIMSQRTPNQTSAMEPNVPPRTLAAPSPTPGEQTVAEAPRVQALDPGNNISEEAIDPKVLETAKLGQNKVPIRPVPTPKMVLQPNGLPVGVTKDAGIVNPEVYKRLPGVQPPLINRDGRDLGPEALQMLQNLQEEKPFPGGIPSASATPMPFPQTVEEINRQLGAYPSPSASQ